MKITSHNLLAFFQLTQDLNFTKAADHLGITQSALSQRVKNLEFELKATLVIREKFNIRLTTAGSTLALYAGKLQKLENELLASFETKSAKSLAGNIRIGGFSSIMRSALIPSLAPLLRQHSNITIETFSAELDQILPMLKSSQVDYAIFNRDPGISSLKALPLGTEDNVLVHSKKFDVPNIYLDHDSNDVTTSSYFKLNPKLQNKNNKMRYLDDVYGILDGVRAGLGRAILPLHLIQGMDDLIILHPRTKIKVPIYLLYFDSPFLTRLEKSVIESVSSYFKKQF